MRRLWLLLLLASAGCASRPLVVLPPDRDAPDATTVIFKMKNVNAAMLDHFAYPRNVIYSAQATAANPTAPPGVYDVKSASELPSLAGTPYNEW